METAEEGRNQNQTSLPFPRAIEFIEVAFRARRLAVFANQTGSPADVGAMVVVSVDRGEDLGRVLAKYSQGVQLPSEPEGVLLRAATENDIVRMQANKEFEKRVLTYCSDRIRMRKLDMKLTGCESQLDRRRVRIYFTAEQRTDFRALVRDLAAEFRARIEMRQIGVRDDARHRDGVGICGQRLCCASFLREFSSVTLKSVREQNLAPNPAKVSGACSRLMCCLAYETELYRRAAKLFPEQGSRHKLGAQNATVTNVDIFREKVKVSWEDGSEESMDIEEFLRRRRKQRTRRGEESEGADQEAGPQDDEAPPD